MKNILHLFLGILLIYSCGKGDLKDIPYDPTPYELEGAEVLGKMEIPEDNKLSYEGIRLGQHLFYDSLLSRDFTISCSSCHDPHKSFTDGEATSEGVEGRRGSVSAMGILNLGYHKDGLFWDGRAQTLEEQALQPVENELEMDNSWKVVVERLKAHASYPKMFREAFGIEDTKEISKEYAAKALAQFQRIILSYDSKFDRVLRGEDVFSDLELLGYDIFFDTELLIPDGECAHCHNIPDLRSDEYFNNGIQQADSSYNFENIGRGDVTKLKFDYGKFKVPTLRNIELTAPYMHDGRFQTLEEVIDHYNSGGQDSPTADVLIYPLELDEEQKSALLALLKTFTDTTFLENELITNPHR